MPHGIDLCIPHMVIDPVYSLRSGVEMGVEEQCDQQEAMFFHGNMFCQATLVCCKDRLIKLLM